MTTTNISYPSSDNKVSLQKARASYKISLNGDEPIIELSLGKAQRGGQGLGKKHRVRELYIDSDNRVFAGFIAKDRSGQFYQYAVIGRLHLLREEAV
jgi:hypothetical protein